MSSGLMPRTKKVDIRRFAELIDQQCDSGASAEVTRECAQQRSIQLRQESMRPCVRAAYRWAEANSDLP